MEERLARYYQWPVYWMSPASGAIAIPPYPQSPDPVLDEVPEEAAETSSEMGKSSEDDETAVRSLNEVVGYCLRGTDGEIGSIEDLIIDDSNWSVRYLVSSAGSWLEGKKVLVAPPWILRVSWAEECLEVDLPRRVVEGLPPYDPAEPVNRVYEERLYDYLGRPRYWVEKSDARK
jgi:hypothetical protein